MHKTCPLFVQYLAHHGMRKWDTCSNKGIEGIPFDPLSNTCTLDIELKILSMPTEKELTVAQEEAMTGT